MEPRFGHDFGHVRVHTDVKAAESAQALNALAYTVGKDMVFGEGQYVPRSSNGKKLLAHELVHILQQNEGNVAMTIVMRQQNPFPNPVDTAKVIELAEPVTNKIASICVRSWCRTRAGRDCNVGKCVSEAADIAIRYVKQVLASRKPNPPGYGGALVWGHVCYEWAQLVMQALRGISNSKCWKADWVGCVDTSIDANGKKQYTLTHNYVFIHLGDIKGTTGPVLDCGLVLDPWRTGDPVVYDVADVPCRWNYINQVDVLGGRLWVNNRWIVQGFGGLP
jgi:hypothetical protein